MGSARKSYSQDSAVLNELPGESIIDYTYPDVTPKALFTSPKEIFKSAQKAFSNMLRKLRKSNRGNRQKTLRRRNISSQLTGRKVRLVTFRAGKNYLAPYETILNSIRKSGKLEPGKPLRVDSAHFLGWERQVQESLTLVLAVDVSSSTMAAKNIITRVISALSANFKRHRDRIGLVAIHGHQAEILNHPSRNHRVVSKSIIKLAVQGLTPLGDGLFKALEMVKIENSRNPGSKPVVIALTDCFPEPITRKCEDLLDEPMYRHAKSAADQFRKRKIAFLIINPSYQEKEYRLNFGQSFARSPGSRLCDELIKRSRGKLIKLDVRKSVGRIPAPETLINEDKQLRNIFLSIESAFTGRQDERNDFGHRF